MGNDMELKKKKKKQKLKLNCMSSKLLESDKVMQENKENKSSGKKKRKREKENQIDAGEDVKFSIEADKTTEGGRKRLKNKSSRKKNRKNEEKNRLVLGKVDGAEGDFDKTNEEVAGLDQSKTQGKTEYSNRPEEPGVAAEMRTSKAKKEKYTKSSKMQVETEPDEVYPVSSGDEDCSKGMKKWITEYHQCRPGLKILQQRIDEFITAHEAAEEQARKEREANASQGGWTVVVHHKGRKKTTDSESGIAVGSVAQAAVMDKMAKKKSKEIGLNFYRFQKREAQRNELMMLQSKFEQDKKRIQQLRAARKFRPY